MTNRYNFFWDKRCCATSNRVKKLPAVVRAPVQCKRCAALPLSHQRGRPTPRWSTRDGPRWPCGSCRCPWPAGSPLCSPARGTGGADLGTATQPEQQDSHRPVPEHFVLGCCSWCGCEDKDLRANINHRLKSAMTTWRNINGIV